ncbi:uroporphyrinogen decarboxylase [Demequina lignilytica]|uniref:Uroporphyrinogen decarboxylase n=1 Tax=Demequina lignilytica TaxID=3051663 RepID=A0AAW7M957_9MICO|nr:MULTISPECIES: uroporphyrinogen decarboxylase [unclassified Demequina]MDN4477628.1 uroporphyrinogen decarboxylase [Demequina sp. SYSU T00039-1]MDN4483672.1 uroporphyrinogen decarboxylase [Demequina sp. SYSU T0a273]MDN4488021.1 uroporphyrinogen decarboxylase [Demequina sp. SYSU T00039]MDN4490461.1 uroporphyrinogen decarboxylase [Demequina sp. SYSU T00068]
MHPSSATPDPSLLAPDHPLADGRVADAPLLAALRGEQPAHRPVWFMRQAGRSLPEYREARRGTTMLESCLTPELATEITLQPVRRYGVDAAIFFSDIVVPMRLAGVGVDIAPGVGPVFERPIRTMDDVEALPQLGEPGDRGAFDTALDVIRETVRLTTAQLGETPLIGFAGAPFTLAAYMVDGRPSRDHLGARRLMLAAPDVWAALSAWTSRAAGLFLRAQVLAGASAVQLFDSWAGSLAASDYEESCLPFSAAALYAVADLPVPRIHFAAHGSHLLAPMAQAGATVMGVDYRLPLDAASRLLGGAYPLQGNVDPARLDAPADVLASHVLDVLARGAEAPGHVVNLGHGVPPETDPDQLQRVVDLVHERG